LIGNSLFQDDFFAKQTLRHLSMPQNPLTFM